MFLSQCPKVKIFLAISAVILIGVGLVFVHYFLPTKEYPKFSPQPPKALNIIKKTKKENLARETEKVSEASIPKTTPEKISKISQEEENPPIQYQRKNISFLKFVSSENCLYFLNDAEIAELKSLNVNGIRVCPGYTILSDGSIKSDIPENWITQLIKRAHRAGFAVLLEVNFAGPPESTGFGGFPHLTDPIYITKLYNISLYWAKIAEKEKVEFFSPLNEPNAVFVTPDLINQWIKKSQDLKSLFSGNLVLKLADIGPEKIGNISKYDYLAFDIMWGDPNYSQLRNYLKTAIRKANNLKAKYHLKGFFFGELGAERARVSKDVQAQIFRTILEETWGKIDGYCFLGWSNLEFKFRDNEKAKSIIEAWYSKKGR